MKFRRVSLWVALCLGVVGAVVAGPSSTVRASTVSYVTSTTLSNCLDGRMCGNIRRVSSCSGTGNRCYAYNANGGSTTFAIGNTTDGVLSGSGERMINRNSGTLRRACGYSGMGGSGIPSASIAYFGWGIMPFTGIRAMSALPVGFTNCDLSSPG